MTMALDECRQNLERFKTTDIVRNVEYTPCNCCCWCTDVIFTVMIWFRKIISLNCLHKNSLVAVVVGNCYFVSDSHSLVFMNGKENTLSINKFNIKTATIIFSLWRCWIECECSTLKCHLYSKDTKEHICLHLASGLGTLNVIRGALKSHFKAHFVQVFL